MFRNAKDENGKLIEDLDPIFTDYKKTYQITLTETSGHYWREAHSLFLEIYEKYKNEMDFNPPAMRELDYNGGTSAYFFYGGNPYLLFVSMEGANHDKYTVSITKCSYNKQGQKEYDEYLEKEIK